MSEAMLGQSSFEGERRETTVSNLLMSALVAIDRTVNPEFDQALSKINGTVLVEKAIEKVEQIEKEDPKKLSVKEKEILDNLDWWLQIYDSGESERAKRYYEEKLKPSQTELEEESAATN